MDKKIVILICVVVALAAVLITVLAIQAAANTAPAPVEVTSESNGGSGSGGTGDSAPDPIVHIVSATMTTGISASGAPTTSVTEYGPADPFIASCQIDTDDPDPVTFVWYMAGSEFHRETVTASGGYAHSEVQSQHTWDPGGYSCDIYLQDSASPDASLAFSVVVPAQ